MPTLGGGGRNEELRCGKCGRQVPKKRLTRTAVGWRCPKCADHLAPYLRRPNPKRSTKITNSQEDT